MPTLLGLNHSLSTPGLVYRWPWGWGGSPCRKPGIFFHGAKVDMFTRLGEVIVLHFIVELPLLVLQLLKLWCLVLVCVSAER